MGAFDKCNAAGDYDPDEPPFTADELTMALDWRQRHTRFTAARQDHCPHPRPCACVADCVECIAWYFRHQRAIEARIAIGGAAVAGYVLGPGDISTDQEWAPTVLGGERRGVQ